MLIGHLRAVGFDSKDARNLKSEENKKHKNRDVDELLVLFWERQQKLPGFYYSLQTDDDGRSVFGRMQLGEQTIEFVKITFILVQYSAQMYTTCCLLP